MEKPKIRQAIVVEGRYDINTVKQTVDAWVIETGGFRLFRDGEIANLIKMAARTRGVIILTDSDRAGFLIRGRLKSLLAGEDVRHAYIPDVPGREKRKTAPSKEGKLGVEGMQKQILLEALERAGAQRDTTSSPAVTKSELYDYGLCGGENSRRLRKAFLAQAGLPERLTSNAMLDVINSCMTRDQFCMYLTQAELRRTEENQQKAE